MAPDTPTDTRATNAKTARIWSFVAPLLESINDAAVAVDTEMRVLLHNQQYATLTGLSRRALQQQLRSSVTAFDMVHATDDQDRAAVLKCFETGRPYRLAEISVQNSQGQAFVVWLSVVPITDEDGRVMAVVQQLRDVSAEARMQASFKELLALSRARSDDLERQVAERTHELTAAYEQVERLSRTDPLTGLLNRRALAEVAATGLEAAKRHNHGAALLMCDLDHFKRVNDRHGHRIGDLVLTTCAGVMKRSFRTIDAVGRFGGEEFVVFLGDTTLDGAVEAANRCRANIESAAVEHRSLAERLVQTASFGVAVFPSHGTTLDDLISAADDALYAAKRSGRNRVVLSGTSGTEAAGYPSISFEQPPEPRRTSETPTAKSLTAPEMERVLIVDPSVDRADTYRRVLQPGCHVLSASSPSEATDLAHSQEFTVFVADMTQTEHSGLQLLSEVLRQQPGAVRILMVEDTAQFEKLLGTNLATVDYVLLRDDFRHLPAAIESSRALRTSYRTFPMARSAQPSRWIMHAAEMERLVRERRIGIAYQPIVDARNSAVFAHEVLCRPKSDLPIDLVDLFDWALRDGQIWNLGHLIRGLALNRLARDPSCVLFFNLHPAELAEPDLYSRTDTLDAYADRVIFEITERATIGDFDRIRQTMSRLRDRGYRFAVDDLGAGYASLNSVAMLNPDFIKVDMAIVRDIHKWPVKARLLRHIVQFAVDEGVRIVAEGIETEEEADAVRDIGCHLLQGYLFGRPVLED